MIVRTAIMVLSLAAGGALQARAQDAAAGEKVFARCHSCHQIGGTARNGIGPKLNGVVGAHSAAVTDFHYSDALKRSDLVWDDANLRAYLAKPIAKVPGTKMAYPGLPSEKDQADVIAYLGRFSTDGTTP